MDCTDTYVEQFNKQALDHLLRHQKYYRTLLRRPSKKEEYDPFTLLTKYANKSKGNKVLVHYSRSHKRGRRFAKGALSMQSFPREIRGALAQGLYYDLDFVNCHPVIIRTMCAKHGFLTAFLDSYINNRDAVINEVLQLNPNLEYDDVKRGILTVIYGGHKDYNSIKRKTEWLTEFKKEIERLHKVVPTWFPEEYELQKQIKDDEFNLEGATLSASVCVVEDKLLQIMTDFLKSKKYVKDVAVLTFDGMMIPQIDQTKLKTAMRHIETLFGEAGYEIKLKVKDFETWSADVPEEYLVEEAKAFDELYRSRKIVCCKGLARLCSP